MSTSTLLTHLKKLAAEVDMAMQADLGTIASPLLQEIVHHAIFQGGKRIRPLLTYLSAALLDKPPRRDIWQLAMTCEYLHAASLLHDDVIDGSDFRRGKETANKIWGLPPVILAGDYLHARAMTIAGTVGGAECIAIIGEATGAMVEAEFLQMETARQGNLQEANYFAVLQGKTAALIAAACETGILHAGGSPAQRQALKLYGANLGIAFQIIDDLLDYLGDPAKTGKAVGNDLREGKMTLPLIYALSQAPVVEKRLLGTLLADARAGREEDLRRATAIIGDCGGFDYAAGTAKTLIGKACDGLLVFPETTARKVLFDLAEYILTREK